jgi:serine/threonine protein kinase
LDEERNIKIVDFGFATMAPPGQLLATFCGSPAYAAPEMITAQRYAGAEADAWSMGVILFALLAGYLPFDDDNPSRLFRRIVRASYTIPDHVTPGAAAFLCPLICPHAVMTSNIAHRRERPCP